MDSLVIHCPTFNDSTPVENTEQMIIYRVSRFGYENCVLDETAKVVGRCAHPYMPLTIRTVFRQFTPLPSGLEYSPGGTYYFISTSDGTEKGIDLTAGGLCLSKQLRLRVHIHPSLTRDSVHRIRHHGHHHVYNSLTTQNDLNIHTTAIPPRYWEEFLNKLHSRDSKWISSDRSLNKWQHRSSPNHITEALSLDNALDDYRKGLEYEREENAVSEALRLDPNFKLFEIHEADDYNSMSFSSTSRMRSSSLAVALILTAILLRL
ncbi:Ephrin-4 [Toxocara canis]|uniref:Ephrin-4 n=1 Tax=Toxocara canis TaxID=6265 RepID=A0A0B2V495_TOXCA|nr:Ephrin-4 [Toxocara canis]